MMLVASLAKRVYGVFGLGELPPGISNNDPAGNSKLIQSSRKNRESRFAKIKMMV